MYKKPTCDYENYDGVKYEEDKATYRKNSLSGPKSRTHWVTGWCPRGERCSNHGVLCDGCYRYSEYAETESK